MNNKFLIATVLILCMTGCSTVKTKFKKYDQTNAYLHSENYLAERVHVSPDMATSNIQDFYPIPRVAHQGPLIAPSLTPPDIQSQGAKT